MLLITADFSRSRLSREQLYAQSAGWFEVAENVEMFMAISIFHNCRLSCQTCVRPLIAPLNKSGAHTRVKQKNTLQSCKNSGGSLNAG